MKAKHKTVTDYFGAPSTKLINYPEIMNQWDWKANNAIGLNPSELSRSSNKKACWQCPKYPDHKWQSVISYKFSHGIITGCPYCAGNLVLAGFNDLLSQYPNVAAQWDYDKNGDLLPSMISYQSHKKVWWKCDKGHSWQAVVKSRTIMNRGCACCAGKRACSENNILTGDYCWLEHKWDYFMNDMAGIGMPEDYLPFSTKSVWWKCPIHGSWLAPIRDVAKGKLCAHCLGVFVFKGENDLQTLRPDIAKLWYLPWNLRDGIGYPDEYTVKSGMKAWFHCGNPNHEPWITTICNVSNGSGCPDCALERMMHYDHAHSAAEDELANVISELMPALHVERQYIIKAVDDRHERYALDVFIPELMIAFEYNGLYWHSEKYRDKHYHHDKYVSCEHAGITLFNVWEDDWLHRRDWCVKHIRNILNGIRVHPNVSMITVNNGELDSFYEIPDG